MYYRQGWRGSYRYEEYSYPGTGMPVGPSCRACVHCAMAVFEVGEWVWLPEPGVGVANTDVIAVPAQVQGQLISAGESGGRVRLESGEERELSAEQTKPLVACSAVSSRPPAMQAESKTEVSFVRGSFATL